MGVLPQPAGLTTFKVGPKNKRLLDPAAAPNQEVGYQAFVVTDVALPDLCAHYKVMLSPEEPRLTPEAFPCANQGRAWKHFELFDFSARADYGRQGVDEAFVREKLAYFKFQPASLVDLICFGGDFRARFAGQWFESKRIVALGSVLTTSEVVRKGGLFRREARAAFRHYPELECVSGRPEDLIRLSTTEPDRDGNWPTDILFLAYDTVVPAA